MLLISVHLGDLFQAMLALRQLYSTAKGPVAESLQREDSNSAHPAYESQPFSPGAMSSPVWRG